MSSTERRIRASASRMRFEPGFSDRVLERIREVEASSAHDAATLATENASEQLYRHLRRAFPRLAAACLVGLLALGTLALVGDTGLAGSPVDALLGLPAQTLETAFALGAM